MWFRQITDVLGFRKTSVSLYTRFRWRGEFPRFGIYARLLDFGYWYAPEGRTAAQQHAFEAVECKPQAMEWLFARACGSRFKLSVDNLDPNSGSIPDTSGFRRQVFEQALLWQQALPQRAAEFYQGLCREFGTTTAVEKLSLSLAELQ